MIEPFTLQLPITVEFGSGISANSGGYAKKLGKKVFIVTDKGIRKAGILDKITASLENESIEYTVFDKTIPNPTDSLVEEGVEHLKKERCDQIITLGGGSSIDAGKGISLLATNQGRIADYVIRSMADIDKMKKHSLPLIAIPTTAGTGSEADGFAVITVVETENKEGIGQLPAYPGGPHLCPTVSLVDPQLTLGLPPRQTASTGMDALAHAIETYIGKGTTPFIEALSLRAIELAANYLPIAYADGANYEAREAMMMASHLAGYGENYVATCGEHALAEATGGIYGNLVHGELVAIFLPYMMEYNRIVSPNKFVKIALAMGERIEGISLKEASKKAIDAINNIISEVNLPNNLLSLGIEKERLSDIADRANQSPNTPDNPRTINKEEYLRIIEKAYE